MSTRVWNRDPRPHSAYSRSCLSLSITTHHARTQDTRRQKTKRNTAAHKAQLLLLPAHTCPKTKTIWEPCPINMSNTPWEKQEPGRPGVRLCVHKEPVRGWLAALGTSALLGLVSRFLSPMPFRPALMNYPLFDPRKAPGWGR